MRKSILIISISKVHRDPRVLRQISFLKQGYDITVAGITDPKIDGINFISIKDRPKNGIWTKVFELALALLRLTKLLYWRQKQIQELKSKILFLERKFDLIIANDADTLPLASYLKATWNSKLIVDLHEYAPRQFENSFLWRVRFSRFFYDILDIYLPTANRVLTVCNGIAAVIKAEFNVDCEVLTNAPSYQDLSPSAVRSDSVEIVHHGVATRSRRIETMIQLMEHLEDRFKLNLILLDGDPGYLEELKCLAQNNTRVKFLDPVSTENIPTFLNQFDIGLFLVKPITFNLEIALPNKFFEFIQARLCIAIGPSVEMKRIALEHDLGVIAKDFRPETLAEMLNRLKESDIMLYKSNSANAARLLSAESNKDLLLSCVSNLLHC